MNSAERVFKDMQMRRASIDTDYSVVMANDMIKGCSELSLNELKLLRTIIMQIKPEDTELYPYMLSVKDFQKMIGVSEKYIYREAQKMCIHLLKEVILIGDGNPKHPWKAFQWVSMCEYDSGKFCIRLNDALKPYIIGLQKFYTKFALSDIVQLNTTYAIRLLELIYEAMKNAPVYADQTTEVYIPVDVIRKATNTKNKYTSISNFIKRVIDIPIQEINKKNEKYHISYRQYKESRKIVGFYFLVESANWHKIKEDDPEIAEQMAMEAYMKRMQKQRT